MNIVNLESLLLHLFYVVYGIKAKLKVVSIQAMRYMPSTPSSFLKLAIGSSAAIVGVTYISSRYEASKCLSCILENPKMNTELFNVTRDPLEIPSLITVNVDDVGNVYMFDTGTITCTVVRVERNMNVKVC